MIQPGGEGDDVRGSEEVSRAPADVAGPSSLPGGAHTAALAAGSSDAGPSVPEPAGQTNGKAAVRGKPGVRLLPEEPEEEPPAPAETAAEDAEGEEGGRHDELPHSGNGDSEPEEGGEGSLGSSSWQLSAGMQAELAFAEDGMVGSWYPVEVLQVRESAVQVLVPGLLDAEQPDGKLREWHPRSRLRPPPPPPGEGFREQLCLGSLAETWYQEGWWQVSVKEIYYGEPESKSGEGGGGSTSMEAMSERRFVLESIQFGNSHRPVVPPPLRPCWRWHPTRQENGGWSLQQTAQRRPQPNNGKRGATKRKQSELTPGAKEIEQEAAARETQRMLQHFAVSNVVEVRGTEDGFLGSWYAARVLEAREARSNVKLRLCYEAFQEDDGSKWEDWIEARHVRPLPPPHKADFVKQLKKGAPLELLLEEGWWEVEFECGPDKGGLCLVSAKRYQVQHTVPAARLRPAWKWTSDCTGWEVHTEVPHSLPSSEVQQPKPPSAAKPPQSKPASKSKQSKAQTSRRRG